MKQRIVYFDMDDLLAGQQPLTAETVIAIASETVSIIESEVTPTTVATRRNYKSKNTKQEANSNLKLAFVYPSTHLKIYGHHTEQTTLISSRMGFGLPALAQHMINAGHYAVGLPIVSVPLARLEAIQQLIDAAIADLWFALGSGATLVFPIRDFHELYSKRPFISDSEGTIGSDKELCLWTHNDWRPNLMLAEKYRQACLRLAEFSRQIQQVSDKDFSKLVESDFREVPENCRQAFLAGAQAAVTRTITTTRLPSSAHAIDGPTQSVIATAASYNVIAPQPPSQVRPDLVGYMDEVMRNASWWTQWRAHPRKDILEVKLDNKKRIDLMRIIRNRVAELSEMDSQPNCRELLIQFLQLALSRQRFRLAPGKTSAMGMAALAAINRTDYADIRNILFPELQSNPVAITYIALAGRIGPEVANRVNSQSERTPLFADATNNDKQIHSLFYKCNLRKNVAAINKELRDGYRCEIAPHPRNRT